MMTTTTSNLFRELQENSTLADNLLCLHDSVNYGRVPRPGIPDAVGRDEILRNDELIDYAIKSGILKTARNRKFACKWLRARSNRNRLKHVAIDGVQQLAIVPIE